MNRLEGRPSTMEKTATLVSVYTKSKRGPLATIGRSVSSSLHVSTNGVTSLCGLPVAVVQERAPSIHSVECVRCFGAWEKLHPTLKDLLDLFVIAIDVGAEGAKYTAYLAMPNQWDASWYTTDFNQIRAYKRAGNAKTVIASYGSQWAHLNPRVVRIGDITCQCSTPLVTTHLDPIACERCGGKLTGKTKKIS